MDNNQSRRQAREQQQKKNTRKWIATGAAAVVLLGGGVAVVNNLSGKDGGSASNSASSAQAVPSECSTSQSVNVETTEAMAKVLQQVPVDAESCVTLNVSTGKAVSDILTESSTGAAASTNLWVPDSSVRAELAMSEANAGLTPIAESLAKTPGVVVSKSGETSYENWSAVLADGETVDMGDPKAEPAAFAALISGISEVSNGSISVEELTKGSGLRAQTIGVTKPAASASELLDAVEAGEVKAAVVTEADYAAYKAQKSDSEITATVPKSGSLILNYPLYQVSPGSNTAVDAASQQIMTYLNSDEGKQALAASGLRASSGEELPDGKGVGAVTELAPNNTEVLAKAWVSYALQSAPLNALVVLDASGSMLEQVEGTGKSRMDITVESVLAGSQLFPARDSMGLWKFSRELTTASGEIADYEELVPVRGFEESADGKTQRELLQAAGSGIAASIHPEDQTALNDTLLAAFRSAKQNYADGSLNAVIMLTDGTNVDEGSISTEELISTIQSEQDPSQPIFVILIGVSEDADMNALNTIASSVGGEAHTASSPSDIQQIFASALTGAVAAAAAGEEGAGQ